ncbi:hypothetical protein KQX54_012530 [Cotesia glomerata]|uniref:EGF-like domain-containing protein n=1 Tax=Cotesia glomerata TaxID=32391 RepID=A0AAV7J4V9_COTGL|nr:hypothetical protein KQX54_012530 [Cotesia glomerata]
MVIQQKIFSFQSIVQYDAPSCTSKYVGEYCQHLNPCHKGPRCQNGGSCRVKENPNGTPSFTCDCPIGFSASLCEIPMDNACNSSPCLNGAACVLHSLEEYTCSCTFGFTGQYCERQDHCSSAPCKNGAECQSLDNGYQCKCALGFTGPTCADDINECDRDPCVYGSCYNTPGSYKCPEKPRMLILLSRTMMTISDAMVIGSLQFKQLRWESARSWVPFRQ